MFEFLELVAIVYWLENINIYVFKILKSYEDTVICSSGNPSTTDLVFHIIQCLQ